MQTNDPIVAILQIAWEMAQEALSESSDPPLGRDDRVEWLRKEFQKNYKAIREEYERQREHHTPSFPPG